MTYDEIIKPLECLAGESITGQKLSTVGQIFLSKNWLYGKSTGEIARNALSLIKRQKEEIERLNVLAELGNMRANDYRAMRDKVKTAREKAIKEFAERLKEDCPADLLVIHFNAIDNLVKEMVGDTK